MSTLLVKIFKNIKAIPVEGNSVPLSQHPADALLLKEMVTECMPKLSKSYAEAMSDWVTAKYFDPAAELQRLLVHDYKQTELKNMRSMDDTKLIDCLEMPLKSFEDLLAAVHYMLENGLSLYLPNSLFPLLETGQHNSICASLFILKLASFLSKVTSFLSLVLCISL